MDTKNLNKKELEIYKKEVAPMVRRAQTVEVTNATESIRAQKMVLDIKHAKQLVHERFDPPVQKAKESFASIKALYNFFIDPFNEAEQIIKKKIAIFETKERAKREEKEAKALERQRKSGSAMPLIQQPTQDALPGVSFVARWRCDIDHIDIKALCGYVLDGTFSVDVLAPNASVLNKLAQTWQDRRKFKGIRFYEETSVKARTL